MKKKEIKDQLRKAKAAHKRWITYAKAIHMGLPIDEGSVPILDTECGFGKWYYGPAQVFDKLDSYQAIEQPHTMLHDLYMQVYMLRSKPVKGGLFSSKKNKEKRKQEELDELLTKIISTSDILLQAIKNFEEDIEAMPESEIMQLMG